MDKYEIAQILREIGMIIELTDVNPIKGIAYHRAARTIESVNELDKYIKEKSLETLPGIGKGIAAMITTLVNEGSLPYYENLKKKIPLDLLELSHLPGLGPKKLRILYENFNITNQKDLETLLNDEKIHEIKKFGFTPYYIKKILASLSTQRLEGRTLLYPDALKLAEAFVQILVGITDKIEIAGALRRKAELIAELDFIAIAKDPTLCISIFTKHGLVKEVLTQDKQMATVLLKRGIKANLFLTDQKTYPFRLLTLTGNNNHLEQLQQESKNQGYILLENSIKPLGSKSKIHEEKDINKLLKLFYIPPELREGYGEIEAAKSHPFILIEESDLKGAFHCHTTYSDGRNTVEEMVQAARDLGWQYIGITDHSKSCKIANGMSEELILQQMSHIKKLNKETHPSFHIFSGVECDILKDGQLDFSEDILKELDFVIASIHSSFNMLEEEMTTRLIKAIENPYTTMIGHLTGRLLNHRKPYQVNIWKIIDACIANNKIIELNSYPNRLDMDWRWWIRAKEKGLKCSINPDAHSVRELENCRYGINMARKGWLEKEDVINTLSLKDMKAFLKSMKP